MRVTEQSGVELLKIKKEPPLGGIFEKTIVEWINTCVFRAAQYIALGVNQSVDCGSGGIEIDKPFVEIEARSALIHADFAVRGPVKLDFPRPILGTIGVNQELVGSDKRRHKCTESTKEKSPR